MERLILRGRRVVCCWNVGLVSRIRVAVCTTVCLKTVLGLGSTVLLWIVRRLSVRYRRGILMLVSPWTYSIG